MDIDKILQGHKNCTEKDMLGMILSNRIDVMFNDKACISIDKWKILSEDLMKWKDTTKDTEIAELLKRIKKTKELTLYSCRCLCDNCRELIQQALTGDTDH